MPNFYKVEPYCDEATITATDLRYGNHVYLLQDILSMQIIKLRKQRWNFGAKTRAFGGLTASVAGLIIAFKPPVPTAGLFGLLIAIVSTTYLLIFYLFIGPRKTGEYGLLIETNPGTKRVLTSNSLRAIQTLYKVLFNRFQQYNPTAETLIVNMYTSETYRGRDRLN